MKCFKMSAMLFLTVQLSAQPIDQKTFAKIFNQVKNSVITININTTGLVNGRPVTKKGFGSGVIVSDDGLIVTNKHVVNDTTRSFKVVGADGQELSATLIGVAPDTDLSIIKLNTVPLSRLKSIPIGDSTRLEEGDWVLAIGSPFGLGGTLTAGIVSAKERPLSLPDESGHEEGRPQFLIQTDTAINPGNSGGALVNMQGELVGIPTIIFSGSGTNAGVGFAIPSNVVKTVLSDILKKRTEVGWLGVLVQGIGELPASVRKQLGINTKEGVVVTGIELGGPAEKAGLKQSDVIISINNQAAKDIPTFGWLERNLNPGEIAIIKIQRRGSQAPQEIKVAVGKPINK